jgi:histidyl-tRNA synthetase
MPYFDADQLHFYLSLAAMLRQAGLGVELYPEPKKLGQQLKYADRRGFRAAVIVGAQERAENICQIKLLATGDSTKASLANSGTELVAELRRLLNGDK